MRRYYKSGGGIRKTERGAALKRWFKEDWKDVSTGKACGRKKGDGRGTPYCRPSKRVSSKTPVTWGQMSAAEKRKAVAEKKRTGMGKRTSSIRKKRKTKKK